MRSAGLSGAFAKGLLRPAAADLAALLKKATPAREHRVIAAALHAHRTGAAPRPPSVDLDPFTPFRANQQTTEACSWHALPLALATVYARLGLPLLAGKVPSMRQGWAMSRAQERAQTYVAGTKMPALQNVGIQLATAIDVAATTGVLPMLVPSTPTGALSDVWTAQDSDPGVDTNEPQLQSAEIAAATLIDGPYAINPQDEDADEVSCAALAAGLVLYDAFEVDAAFESLAAGDVAQAPIDAPDDGGHAVFRSGYRTNADGSVDQILTNSWGNGWSWNGRCWVSRSWRQKVWATFVICPPGYAQ